MTPLDYDPDAFAAVVLFILTMACLPIVATNSRARWSSDEEE